MSIDFKKYIKVNKIISLPLLLIICLYSPKIEYFNQDNCKYLSYYENNIDFRNYSTSIKVIAIYIPKIKIHFTDDYSGEFFYKRNLIEINESEINDNKETNLENDFDLRKIENQIELAKSHGIYGFGIYYYYNYDSSIIILNNFFDLVYDNKNIDFNYLLILKNEDKFGIDKDSIKKEYNQKNFVYLIDKVSKYLLDKRYIKINNIPVIGLYSPENIKNLGNIISIWRNKVIKHGIKKIYILGISNKNNLPYIEKKNIIDLQIYLPDYKNNFYYEIGSKRIYPYFGLIYKQQKIENNNIFASSFLPFQKEKTNKLKNINTII